MDVKNLDWYFSIRTLLKTGWLLKPAYNKWISVKVCTFRDGLSMKTKDGVFWRLSSFIGADWVTAGADFRGEKDSWAKASNLLLCALAFQLARGTEIPVVIPDKTVGLLTGVGTIQHFWEEPEPVLPHGLDPFVTHKTMEGPNRNFTAFLIPTVTQKGQILPEDTSTRPQKWERVMPLGWLSL